MKKRGEIILKKLNKFLLYWHVFFCGLRKSSKEERTCGMVRRMPLKISLLVIGLLIFLPYVSMADSPLDHWHWRSPLPQGNNLWGVTYGNSIFVAVGDGGTILTSTDGVNWTIRTSGTIYWLDGVTCGNNTFVVVGYGGTILTSTDGASWIIRTSGTTKDLYGISFANNTFVTVGDAGTILTSPDGVNWTIRTSGTTTDLNGVTYGNNTFVAVGPGRHDPEPRRTG